MRCADLRRAGESASRRDRAPRSEAGNIMLTASGAKLLDFGLAKPAAAILGGAKLEREREPHAVHSHHEPDSAESHPPAALTQQGTIVGTFQYMAPEVLQGREADARSDIFSFGCVLYEMVTGRKAFDGKSQFSVLSAILEKEPEPLATVQPAAPPALDFAVQTCLEKNPDSRYQTAHDLKLQLAWIAKSGSQTGIPAVGASKGHKNRLWFTALAFARPCGRGAGCRVLARATAAAGFAIQPAAAHRHAIRDHVPQRPSRAFAGRDEAGICRAARRKEFYLDSSSRQARSDAVARNRGCLLSFLVS